MGGFPTNVEYFEIDKTRSFKRTFNGGHCCKTRNVRVVSTLHSTNWMLAFGNNYKFEL